MATRFICWNVNGIRAWHKKGGMDWLLAQKPDFFCVQETKAHPEQLTEALLSPDGYTAYFDHARTRKGYSGVAIYAKEEPEEVRTALGIPELDQEGRFLALLYPGFALLNCYFPNGGGEPRRFEYKLAYYEAFLKYAQKLVKEGYSVVFCGDVNAAHKEIDLKRAKENDGEIGFHPKERAWIDKVVGAKFHDTFRLLHPDARDAYSWWDMKTGARARNVGWRIDYFFVSDDLKGRVAKAEILSDVLGSDHCPIALELR
jgi:exodeoxyribonuclease-3